MSRLILNSLTAAADHASGRMPRGGARVDLGSNSGEVSHRACVGVGCYRRRVVLIVNRVCCLPSDQETYSLLEGTRTRLREPGEGTDAFVAEKKVVVVVNR